MKLGRLFKPRASKEALARVRYRQNALAARLEQSKTRVATMAKEVKAREAEIQALTEQLQDLARRHQELANRSLPGPSEHDLGNVYASIRALHVELELLHRRVDANREIPAL